MSLDSLRYFRIREGCITCYSTVHKLGVRMAELGGTYR